MAEKECSSFRVDFTIIQKKINRGDIVKFLSEKLQLVTEKLEKELLHASQEAVIQMKKANEAREFVENHDNKHGMVFDGVEYKIPIRMDDNSKIIKIMDCSSTSPMRR